MVIDFNELHLKGVIGSGAFATVFRAVYRYNWSVLSLKLNSIDCILYEILYVVQYTVSWVLVQH
jgi:hypothetical protein